MAADKTLMLGNCVIALIDVRMIDLDQTTVLVGLRGVSGETYSKTFTTEKDALAAYTALVKGWKEYLAYA